jgi:hypothetical protein
LTVDEILAEVEKRMGALDERAKQAVTLALQLAEQHGLPKWRGENPTWDEWQRMSEEERQAVMDELEQRNRVWLEWMRQTLRAYWLFVVDGQVVLHGESPKDFPSPDDIETLCRRLGKVPLWYEPSPTIEEGTAWQPTIYPDDAYPTLTVVFSDGGRRWETIADFDTGAVEVYAGAELLEGNGIVTFPLATLWRQGQHLGQTYRYTRIPLQVALRLDDGTEKSMIHPVLCVRNWQQSPFVAVNPNRTALIGRSLCLATQAKILLDFAQQVTSVQG